jgi:hypothetical protein
MVCSISVSIRRMVGFLDRSPYMNRMKFGSYNSFSTAMLMSLELHSIATLHSIALELQLFALAETLLPQN